MKNFLRVTMLAICAIFMVANVSAQVITAERASEIANKFFANGKQKSAAFRSTNATLTQSFDSRAVTGESNDAPTFHILTGADGKGFVIVSGEETENPIIGYSFDGTIDTNNLPDGFVDYMTDIDAQVRALREYNAANPQKAAARSAMQKAANFNYDANLMGEIVVDLKTAPWGQHGPFNKLCPVINGVNALTGCVPTAFAILCHYHKWPENGSGTYTNSGQTIDISTSTYDYASMRNDNYSSEYTEAEANAVALLMRDLGFAYGVLYGTSSTDKSENATTLKSAFSYKSEYNPSGSGMDAMWRSSVGDETFIASLKECLDKKRPIPFSSKSVNPETGKGSIRHIFILDGYTKNNYFHFNYGWEGNGNGWYTINFMQPDDVSDYSTEQRAYLDLIPNRTPRTVTVSADPTVAGTVTVNDIENSAEVTEGTYATLKATANSGYTFSHWSKGGAQVSTEKTYKALVAAEGNDYVANFLTVGNNRVNVSVSYNSSYGTVTYNSNAVSGTGITPYQNSEVTLVATPLDGYVFNGWTVEKGTNSTNYAGTELTFVATGDMSVEANFSTAEIDYSVTASTLTKSGNEQGADYCSTYTFNGGVAFTLTTTIDDVEAYALTTDNQYIDFYATAHTKNVSDAFPTNIKYTLSAPEGYLIKKYSFDLKSSTGTYSINVNYGNNNVTIDNSGYKTISETNIGKQSVSFILSTDYNRGRAKAYVDNFSITLEKISGSTPTPDPTPVTYIINATAGVGGSVTINGDAVSQKSVNENSPVTLVATPQTGYRFVNWTSGTSPVSTDATYTFTATGHTSLVANFEQATYTVNVEATEGGSAYIGTKGTTQATAAYNGNVTITAEANDGYRFVEWRAWNNHFSPNAIEENVTVTTDVTYTAVFEPEAAEPEQPEFDGTKEETSYTDANWFRNNKGSDIDYGTESWGYKVVTENKTSTVTLMVKDKDNSGYYKNNIGFRSVEGVNHPFLFKGTTFTISVPEQHKITGYSMTVVGENFNTGTVTYTTGAQMARSNTSTATINGTNPTTLNATGLDTNSIEITLGSATASTAGVTITNLDIYYKESEPEYTLGDRLTSAQLMSITNPTHIAVKNLSKTNNWYFAGETNVEDFGNDAVFVWTPKTEGVAGEYYLKTLDGKYLGAAGNSDNTPISYTEDVANAAVFTTLKPVAGSTGTSKLDKDSDTGEYVDNDDLLVRFMTKYSGGTGDVTTWINVTHYTTPNHPKYYNGGYGMYTAHFVYAVSVDGVAPEIPGEQLPTDPLAGKYFRLKEKSTGNYMNIANTSNNTGSTSGVTVVAKNENSNNQIFLFEQSGDGYKLKANSGNYIKCHSWNANANTTDANEATVLTFETTANELEYLIKWDNKNTDYNGTEMDDYFKVQNVNGTVYVFDNATRGAAATWVLEEVVMQKVYIKAEIENWRNDNPNTHLGTITIGGTAVKLTPAHQTASEFTMPLAEGTTLAFTRKYRGFEFNGFYIGETSLGTDPTTLTADNVAAINETTPLVAKFTATDDVTLFYDDDTYSYRIPAIAKTGTNRLVAVSDYRHSHDDIGRDNHGTGTYRVDLVMRTSDDNGLTWSAKQTIAEGDPEFGYGDAAVVANGEDILVMAVAGKVFFANANANNKQRTYRIYSPDNGATWNKEEVSNNLYTLFPNGYGMFFGSGKLVVDPNFNNSGNARVYGAVLLNDGKNYVVYSDNWGSTWNILGGGAAASANEPKVEILPNGQILLSARRDGGRTFNVFTYTDKANNAGTWSTATNGCDNDGNSTNGEIICLDAKLPNGMDTKILLQSQPFGSDRRNVSIWYKEISANETYTATEIASDWTKGKQVSTQLSAYSAMCLQENGEIALFFEEAPCHNDDHTYGYSMVYVPLTIEEITNDNFLNPDADVEYVPTEFNIVLTDAQDNEYRETLDYIPADVAAVESYLTGKYSFITLGNKGAIADNTYTNSVTLPFKVSNADNAYWHNIYWPSYNPPSGKIGCPVYLSATVGEQYVPKVKADALYGASEYNTLDWADRLSWAVYSVNNSLTFKFKNKSANKYIQVTSVASGSAQNTVYVDEGNATVFTLLKDTGTRIGDYALVAKVGETTGYLCSTSVGYDWATHFEHTNHEGAWVVFQEEEVVSSIQDLNIALNLFGEGALHVITDEVQGIITALESPDNIKLNTLDQYGTVLDNAMTNWKMLTLTVDENEGTVTINNETRKTKKAPSGFEFTVVATPKSGYSFVNWTDAGGNEVSTNATYTFNMPDAATELTANFEIEESQEGLTNGYYHIVSRVTASHEYLYNNALRTNNSKKYTLQSDSKVTTNNGIWHITVNDTKLGVKNGDGNALVTGAAYRGAATSHETLTIEKTTVVNDVTYYSFIAGINSTNRTQYNFTLEGTNPVKATDNNYVTTWAGHPDDQANQWRLERIDTDGKNIYNVVVECTDKENVYVTYGSGTDEEYAFNGGFFITNEAITAQQLTAKKDGDEAQGVTVLVEGNTISVVDTEYVEITVSASPAEGGTVTINSEATSTKQVVKSSNVTVVATPASGYHFVNWTDAGGNDVSTDASHTFTASESTSLVANFEADVVYHTITVSKYYANNGGTVKVGEEDATSVNVAEGESVRMLATVANGYEFMGWLKDGVIVKNAINGGLDFEVQGPDYTLYNITAPAEYVAVFSKITETTRLEDGKAYRICGVQGNGRARCIYRDGKTLKWKYEYDNNDVNTIFVAQKNGNAINLISAVGYHGWKASNMLGNDEQYNPYAAIKVTYGTRDELRTLYLESGTSNGLFQTNTDGAFSFQNSRGGGLTMIATDEVTTDFLFEEVDTYAFQVSAADGSNAKLGTVNLPFATTVPAEVTVYGVNNSNEDYVYVAPLELADNVLPANTPVLIEAAASGKYGFKPAPASDEVYNTGFAGTLEAEAIPGITNAYILAYDNGPGTTIKMYKLHSTERTINANKAYFIDSTGRALALQFVFGGTTDIEEVEREGIEDTIYDLQGRKLSEITEPGMYIINGKKVYKK